MRIPPLIYDAMLNHCRDEHGARREACGVLAGPMWEPGIVTEWFPLDNVHDQPDARWRFDPDEQVKLWMRFDRRNYRPRVIYHSHLDTPAVMSPEDVKYASDPSIGYLVVSLSDGDARLWSKINGHLREQALLIADEHGVRYPSEFDPVELRQVT